MARPRRAITAATKQTGAKITAWCGKVWLSTKCALYLLQDTSRNFKEESINIKRLNTELIITSLPPIDKCLPFQLLSLFCIRSSTFFQSLLFSFR